MSTRRVELVQGGSGVARGETGFESSLLGKLLRSQELKQAEEPVRVVFERGRAQEQHVPVRGGDRRHRSPGWLAGMSWWPSQPLCLVHDEQIDPRRHRLRGQLGPGGQRLEGDHRPPVQLEGVEPLTEVALDVGEAPIVEQREDLVILAPQLAQPLHGERGRRHHQAAFDLPSVDEMVEDQARLDGLAEPHFVREQPAHRVALRGPLGDVELVRKQPHPSAQERAETVGLADAAQVQDVEPEEQVGSIVGIAQRQAIQQRPFELERPQRVRGLGAAVGQS